MSRIQQYSDVVLTFTQIKDYTGTLYTGTAKLYLSDESTADLTAVDPVDVAIVSGAGSYEFSANVAGVVQYQIRAEGATHGSSPVMQFRVDPSPYNAPVTP